jgi:hypothetical protein
MIYIYLIILLVSNLLSFQLGRYTGKKIIKLTPRLLIHNKYIIKQNGAILLATNDGCAAREEWERQKGSSGMEWLENGVKRA